VKNPRRRTTVAKAAGGDALHVLDDQQQAYALNPTSALVWQNCNGHSTPEQLAELLRQTINVPHTQAEQLTWLALDELGKANLLEAEVARPASPGLARRQMLTGSATAGIALALLPMVAPVASQAAAEALPAANTAGPLRYFLKVGDFIDSLVEIPAHPIRGYNIYNTTTESKYLAGIADIYIPAGDGHGVGRCSASFLCFKNEERYYTDIVNYLSVDNGLIVSWLTPSTLINLELDNIIHSMVTECIVVASTKIGVNPFFGKTFDLVVSSKMSAGTDEIHFDFSIIK